MDSATINREGIEKILTTMLPTEEETKRIVEAQGANPDIPLGTAEQFLLTLGSIPELSARFHLWAFRLDYDSLEAEIAEPMMDLKLGIEELRKNRTFKYVLATLLAIGNFLNGTEAPGFTTDYLTKLGDVKDTVHKHSLLHHITQIIVDQFTDASDLYSEIGAITRCARADWDEAINKLTRLESDCKASWEHLQAVCEHETNANFKSKLIDFLSDCAERIIVLKMVLRRLTNRFQKFLLYLGYPPNAAKETKVNDFCKTISEFALEFRTTREKMIQQREKKATQRERKKTRGKMIVETENFANKSKTLPMDREREDDLKKLLKSSRQQQLGPDATSSLLLPGAKARKRYSFDKGKPEVSGRGSLARSKLTSGHGSETEGVDDLLDAVVRSATDRRGVTTRDKRARNPSDSSRRSWRNSYQNDY